MGNPFQTPQLTDQMNVFGGQMPQAPIQDSSMGGQMDPTTMAVLMQHLSGGGQMQGMDQQPQGPSQMSQAPPMIDQGGPMQHHGHGFLHALGRFLEGGLLSGQEALAHYSGIPSKYDKAIQAQEMDLKRQQIMALANYHVGQLGVGQQNADTRSQLAGIKQQQSPSIIARNEANTRLSDARATSAQVQAQLAPQKAQLNELYTNWKMANGDKKLQLGQQIEARKASMDSFIKQHLSTVDSLRGEAIQNAQQAAEAGDTDRATQLFSQAQNYEDQMNKSRNMFSEMLNSPAQQAYDAAKQGTAAAGQNLGRARARQGSQPQIKAQAGRGNSLPAGAKVRDYTQLGR